VPIGKRCNEVNDCKDKTDETNCQLIKIITDLYHTEYPPISVDKEPTNVFVNLSILYIDKLDEIGMIYSVKVHIQLKWYDKRLIFYNLRDEMKRGNVVSLDERDDLWIPKLVFTNSQPEFRLEMDSSSFLMVIKEGLPAYDEIDDLQENEQYTGSENPIVYEKFIDLNLRCSFEFSKYPFDQQTCSILVSYVLYYYIQ
jgi:hypothetical protein